MLLAWVWSIWTGSFRIWKVCCSALRPASDKDNTEVAAPQPRRAPRFEILYPGGAVLRQSRDLDSAKLEVLPCGSVVSLIEDCGRRWHVRAGTGASGWISARGPDDEPIVRRLPARDAEVEELPTPRQPRAAADRRENANSDADFHRKWQRIRVDVVGSEAKPLSIRHGTPGMLPISRWRPSRRLGNSPPPRGIRDPIGVRFASGMASSSSDIPRLEAPPEPSKSSKAAPHRSISVSTPEDLLDFSSGPSSTQHADRPMGVPALADILSTWTADNVFATAPPAVGRTARVDMTEEHGTRIPEAPPSRSLSGVGQDLLSKVEVSASSLAISGTLLEDDEEKASSEPSPKSATRRAKVERSPENMGPDDFDFSLLEDGDEPDPRSRTSNRRIQEKLAGIEAPAMPADTADEVPKASEEDPDEKPGLWEVPLRPPTSIERRSLYVRSEEEAEEEDNDAEACGGNFWVPAEQATKEALETTPAKAVDNPFNTSIWEDPRANALLSPAALPTPSGSLWDDAVWAQLAAHGGRDLGSQTAATGGESVATANPAAAAALDLLTGDSPNRHAINVQLAAAAAPDSGDAAAGGGVAEMRPRPLAISTAGAGGSPGPADRVSNGPPQVSGARAAVSPTVGAGVVHGQVSESGSAAIGLTPTSTTSVGANARVPGRGNKKIPKAVSDSTTPNSVTGSAASTLREGPHSQVTTSTAASTTATAAPATVAGAHASSSFEAQVIGGASSAAALWLSSDAS